MKGNRLVGGVAVLFVFAAALTGGCGPDPKERIAMLEENNTALVDQLNGLQNELAQAQAERDACNQDLATARGEAANLRNQLAVKPKEVETVPAGWTAVPGGAMIPIQGWALFGSGKATIQGGSKRILDAVIKTLQNEYPSKDVLVFGHTDDMPIKASGWKDNWELSSQRSLSVVRYMTEHGVNPQRLVACGCGEFRPTVPNDTSKARQKNRRVEIFAIDPQPRTGTR